VIGQRVWESEAPSMVPLEGRQAKFRLAVFPTIGASIRSYMRNLNTHPAYEEFRRQRRQMRRQGALLDPVTLAGGMVEYSTRGQEYVEEVVGFIEFNDLRRFDRSATEAPGGSSG